MKNGDFSKAEVTKNRIVCRLCNRWLVDVFKKETFYGVLSFRA